MIPVLAVNFLILLAHAAHEVVGVLAEQYGADFDSDYAELLITRANELDRGRIASALRFLIDPANYAV